MHLVLPHTYVSTGGREADQAGRLPRPDQSLPGLEERSTVERFESLLFGRETEVGLHVFLQVLEQDLFAGSFLLGAEVPLGEFGVGEAPTLLELLGEQTLVVQFVLIRERHHTGLVVDGAGQGRPESLFCQHLQHS